MKHNKAHPSRGCVSRWRRQKKQKDEELLDEREQMMQEFEKEFEKA